MVKRTLLKREKYLMLITAALIGCVVSFRLVIGPFMDRYSRLDKQIGTFNKKIHKYREYQKDPAFQGNVGKGSQMIFKEFLEVLSSIEALARESGAEVLEMRPDVENTKQLKSCKQVFINLRIRGSTEHTLNFLYEIDKASSNFRIERLALTSHGGAENLEASLVVSGIYLLPA